MSISRLVPHRVARCGKKVRTWADHRSRRLLAAVVSRWQMVGARPEAGMATAEYAISPCTHPAVL